MKCLSIQQPWASLICSGVKDIENRSWRVNDAPGRILIHAGLKPAPKSSMLYMHYAMLMQNAATTGHIPAPPDFTLGAIIGYADVVDIVADSDSPWADEGHGAEWKWVIKNAKLFKTPIPYKGNRGLFDVPEIDESNLPETVIFDDFKRDGETLTFPLAHEIFDTLDEYESQRIYLTDANLHFFSNEELEPIPTRNIIFLDQETKETREFELIDIYIDQVLDDKGEPIIYSDPRGNELELIGAEYFYQFFGEDDE